MFEHDCSDPRVPGAPPLHRGLLFCGNIVFCPSFWRFGHAAGRRPSLGVRPWPTLLEFPSNYF